ncbi:MAG: tetratricopeptide repeat protein [Acidobacteriota bacterium]
MDQATPTPVTDERIDSWKGVAAFLSRDRRTVQRWEKDRGLPVHRVPGGNGTIFAFKTELKAWLQSVPAEVNDPPRAARSSPNQIIKRSPGAAFNALARSSWQSPKAWISVACALSLVPLALLFAKHRQAPVAVQTVASHTSPSPGLQRAGQTLGAPRLPSTKAKELYLEGMFDSNRRTQDGLEKALGDFRSAVAEDSDYAVAYVGLAQTYELMPEFGTMSARAAYPRAIQAAQRAIALDPSSADAHRVLAFGFFYWDWNVPAAEAEFRRSIELEPDNPETHHWYANMLLTLRRIPEAEKEIQRARELDPNSRAILADSLLIEFAIPGKSKQSIAKLVELEEKERDFISPMRYLSALYLSQGDYERYAAELLKVAASSHSAMDEKMAQAAAKGWKAAGKDGVNRSLREVEEREFREGRASGYELALTCLRLGDTVAGLRYLNAAVKAHDYFMFTLAHCYDSAVAPALERPEFRSVLENVASHIHAKGAGA